MIEAIMFLYCHCRDHHGRIMSLGGKHPEWSVHISIGPTAHGNAVRTSRLPSLYRRSLLTSFRKWFAWEALLQPHLDQQLKEFILRGLEWFPHRLQLQVHAHMARVHAHMATTTSSCPHGYNHEFMPTWLQPRVHAHMVNTQPAFIMGSR